MEVLGRNEICYCGSNKKYKKCCLQNDQKRISQGELPSQFDKSFSKAIPTHDISMGIKELVLAQLEQINIWLSRENILAPYILNNSRDLLEIAESENMTSIYLRINKEVLDLSRNENIYSTLRMLNKRAEILASLNENEKLILEIIAESNIGELVMLGDDETADYSAMRILNEFCYEVIKRGIPNRQHLRSATLYIDSIDTEKEILKNWEFTYSSEKRNDIPIKWKPLNGLNDEYYKYAHTFAGLEEQSKNELATTLYQEKAILYKSKDRASYRGLITGFTGIFEKELEILIEMKEGKTITGMTLKNINDYLAVNEIPYFTDNIPDLYDRMEKIRKIRNLAAHGEQVTDIDYNFIKEFAIESSALKYISMAKNYYENESKEDLGISINKN